MALTEVTISFNVHQLLGGDFDTRRTKAYVKTNIANCTIQDTSTRETRLGDQAVTIAADGTGSWTTWAPEEGVSNPASWQETLVVDYPRTGQRDRATRSFGPYTLSAANDGDNVTDLEEEQAVPAEYITQVTEQIQDYVDAWLQPAEALFVSFRDLDGNPIVGGTVTLTVDTTTGEVDDITYQEA